VIPVHYNLRSLMVRRVTSATTALVISLVIMILFILSGFIAGLRATVLGSAVVGDWIVLSRGTTSEPDSFITREQYEILRTRPQIARDSHGQELISPEIITGFNPAPEKPYDQTIFTFLRGVYPIAYEVHRGMRIERGRWPAEGQAELAIGRKLAARFPNLQPGSVFRFGRRGWKIAGIFSDSDSARESEVITDLNVLAQDVRYANGFAVIHLALRPGSFATFAKSLTTDARLRVDVTSEADFYATQSRFVDQLRTLGLAVALLLAIGTVFGAMNTMYAAVARRTGEIGILRALGFGRFDILMSFMAESVLLGVAGGIAGEILGLLVAYAVGLRSQLMNVGLFIFTFRLSPSAFLSGILAAIAIGAAGGILPAWRASRITIVESLRAA
jgi:ABC-type lipoprotein release transport system permease subunit